MRSNNQTLKLLVITGFFIALIFFAAYLLHIPTPATGGYIHLGDAFLYLGASLLPTPFAVAAGSLGEALSDVLSGSAIYAVPTLIIKALMALCFTAKSGSIISKRNIAASVAAGLICTAGYYLAESVIIYGNFISPAVEIPANLLQAASSAVVFLLLGKAFDRLNFKKRMGGYFGL